MGGGLPRKWTQSFSNVPALASIRRTSTSEARKAVAAAVETAKRLARFSAERVGGLASDAARSASEAVHQAALAPALAKAQSAKLLAVQGAQRTGRAVGRAVVQSGGTLRRQATTYIKANVDSATESLRMRGTLAVAQMQSAFSEYSLKFVQAATDFAVRVISKEEENRKTKGSDVKPIGILTTKETKKRTEDTACPSKRQ